MWAYLASCKEWFDSAGDRDQTFASEPPSADAIRARRIQYYALRVALPLRQPTDLCLSPYIAACGSPPVPQNPFQGGLDHAVIWKRNPSQNPSQNPSRNPSRKPSQHPSLTLLSKDLSRSSHGHASVLKEPSRTRRRILAASLRILRSVK